MSAVKTNAHSITFNLSLENHPHCAILNTISHLICMLLPEIKHRLLSHPREEFKDVQIFFF